MKIGKLLWFPNERAHFSSSSSLNYLNRRKKCVSHGIGQMWNKKLEIQCWDTRDDDHAIVCIIILRITHLCCTFEWHKSPQQQQHLHQLSTIDEHDWFVNCSNHSHNTNHLMHTKQTNGMRKALVTAHYILQLFSIVCYFFCVGCCLISPFQEESASWIY